MLAWIKKLFWTDASTEQEVQSVPPHFHVERHAVQQYDLPDFTNYEKIDIDIWARQNHNIRLDRRKSKNNMIEELKSQLESKES